jgi:hypothetical protein
MKCPYCFKVTYVSTQRKKGSRLVNYCNYCKSEVPRDYIESPDLLTTKIGMVGYSGHGKTTYTTSLLFLLNSIHAYWSDFYFEMLDDYSNNAMYNMVNELEQGNLPPSSPAIFPRPTFIRLNNLPYFNTQFASMFDTGGQLFDNLELMTRKGRYLTQANVIFFFISLTEEDMKDNWNLKIMKLLDRYINVVYSRYGTKTSVKQNIMFIFTKSDELLKLNGQEKLSEDIVDYFKNGVVEQYAQINENSFERIKQNSDDIEAWLRSNNCNSFINYAKDHFKKVSFVLTSALGNTLVNNNFDKKLSTDDPRCIFDPLIWAMHISN